MFNMFKDTSREGALPTSGSSSSRRSRRNVGSRSAPSLPTAPPAVPDKPRTPPDKPPTPDGVPRPSRHRSPIGSTGFIIAEACRQSLTSGRNGSRANTPDRTPLPLEPLNSPPSKESRKDPLRSPPPKEGRKSRSTGPKLGEAWGPHRPSTDDVQASANRHSSTEFAEPEESKLSSRTSSRSGKGLGFISNAIAGLNGGDDVPQSLCGTLASSRKDQSERHNTSSKAGLEADDQASESLSSKFGSSRTEKHDRHSSSSRAGLDADDGGSDFLGGKSASSRKEKSERSEKKDKSEKHDKHDKHDKHEKHVKHEKHEKHEKQEKHERHDRSGKTEKSHKSDKNEKTHGSAPVRSSQSLTSIHDVKLPLERIGRGGVEAASPYPSKDLCNTGLSSSRSDKSLGEGTGSHSLMEAISSAWKEPVNSQSASNLNSSGACSLDAKNFHRQAVSFKAGSAPEDPPRICDLPSTDDLGLLKTTELPPGALSTAKMCENIDAPHKSVAQAWGSPTDLRDRGKQAPASTLGKSTKDLMVPASTTDGEPSSLSSSRLNSSRSDRSFCEDSDNTASLDLAGLTTSKPSRKNRKSSHSEGASSRSGGREPLHEVAPEENVASVKLKTPDSERSSGRSSGKKLSLAAIECTSIESFKSSTNSGIVQAWGSPVEASRRKKRGDENDAMRAEGSAVPLDDGTPPDSNKSKGGHKSQDSSALQISTGCTDLQERSKSSNGSKPVEDSSSSSNSNINCVKGDSMDCIKQACEGAWDDGKLHDNSAHKKSANANEVRGDCKTFEDGSSNATNSGKCTSIVGFNQEKQISTEPSGSTPRTPRTVVVSVEGQEVSVPNGMWTPDGCLEAALAHAVCTVTVKAGLSGKNGMQLVLRVALSAHQRCLRFEPTASALKSWVQTQVSGTEECEIGRLPSRSNGSPRIPKPGACQHQWEEPQVGSTSSTAELGSLVSAEEALILGPAACISKFVGRLTLRVAAKCELIDDARAKLCVEVEGELFVVPSFILAKKHVSDLYTSAKECFCAGEDLKAIQKSEEVITLADVMRPRPRELGDALNLLGALHLRRRSAGVAVKCLQRALVVRAHSQGTDDVTIASTLSTLGSAHEALGAQPEALQCHERAVQLLEKHPPSAALASALHSLGRAHSAMGKQRSARPCYEKALTIREDILGADHPLNMATLNNLGTVLQQLSDFRGAIRCYHRALAIETKISGHDNPVVAATLGNLGSAHTKVGEHKHAIDCHSRVLKILEKAFGKDHPSVATALHNLGTSMAAYGWGQDAARCLWRALGIWSKTVGAAHPDIASALHTLGNVYRGMEQPEAAAQCFEGSVRIRKAVLGDEHPQTARTQHCAALVQCHQGNHAEALRELQAATAALRNTLGAMHPWSMQARADAEHLSQVVAS